MKRRPEISVIITSYNAKQTIEATFKSLEEQETSRRFEIILVDSSTDGTADLIAKKYPHVKVCRFSERKYCGDARNIGVSVAKGKIVAFTDADCRVDRNWIEAIAEAHESPYLVIGGAIANANPKSYIGWAAYFTEFSHWMPGTQHIEMDDVAGANMSYKKEVFDYYGAFIGDTYGSDTDFHWRIGKDGRRLLFVSTILVSHHNIENLKAFLRHEILHGQSFARVRVQNQGFQKCKRLAYLVLTLLIPIRIFSKICRNIVENQAYAHQFLKTSPFVVLGVICWSFGEAMGYARG
jgi:glycosyltransferase involved in cell wall biosynthesis